MHYQISMCIWFHANVYCVFCLGYGNLLSSHWSSKIIWYLPNSREKKKTKKCQSVRVQWKNTNRIFNSHIGGGYSIFVGQFHSFGQISTTYEWLHFFTHAFLFMENNPRIVISTTLSTMGVWMCVCVCVLKVVAPLFCGIWDVVVYVKIGTVCMCSVYVSKRL